MKLRWDNQHVRWGVTAFLVIAASMLFYYGVFHMRTLITGIQTFLGILTPIIYGVVIAFLLTPVLNFMEKNLIYPLLARKEVAIGKKGRKAIRWAMDHAEKDDIIVLAGKGHETYQILGTVKTHLDEREEVAAHLQGD